ncbi:hypothetical protein [Flavobacterium sp. UBA4197]|uniref:hypothetical protein n=1 Tax=Flavobacterium sp. UBA4197 TaxID=1946546 RepID=UPI00257D1DC0|nr:hypothetical protein [Flavobacterium sp. UBA4197]
MRTFKPKYYIVFPRKMVNEMTWPTDWGHKCAGNLSEMLQDVLKVKTIGSELKLIWNSHHRYQVIKDNNITDAELDDYVKSDCSMISFQSAGTMKRAVKSLEKMGGKNFVCLDSYREVILQQAHYKNNCEFFLKK